jgi:hypothetical protein
LATKKKSRRNRRESRARSKTFSPKKQELKLKKKLGLTPKVRQFTASKLGESVDSNEDSFKVSLAPLTIALSDGSSRSFKPKKWSSALVSSLSNSQSFLKISDIKKISQKVGKLENDDLPWNLEEIRLRGSQATFMRLQLVAQEANFKINCLSIGDSLLVLQSTSDSKSPNPTTRSWPFETLQDFPNAPSVVSSIEPFLVRNSQRKQSFKVNRCDFIYLMTDALARHWVEQNIAGKNMHQIFPFLNDQDHAQSSFEVWATENRTLGLVEDDDLTIIEISLS